MKAASKIIYKRRHRARRAAAHTQVINFIVNVPVTKMKQFVSPTGGDEKHYLAGIQ